MMQEFIDSVLNAQVCPTERPQIQQQARAITYNTPPLEQTVTQGGLAYPYPGKNPSGEV